MIAGSMGVTPSVKWVGLTVMTIVALAGWRDIQSPQPTGRAAADGVRCPAAFRAIWNDSAKILRCRRDVVSWVVTTCTDKAFANYVVKRGADSCGPTEIPGVGTPPGVRASRSVSCAASGYELMTDRTGERDRCERVEQTFAMPLPAA